MSGYLQRMALSAMKPGGSIQPIVGSLFAPSPHLGRPEDAPLDAVQPANPRAPGQLPQPPAERPSRHHPVSQSTEPPAESPHASELAKDPVAVSIETFTPIFPVKGGEQQDDEPRGGHSETKASPTRELVVPDLEIETAARTGHPPAQAEAPAPSRATEAAPRQAAKPLKIKTSPPEEPVGHGFRVVPAFKQPANRGDEMSSNGTPRTEPDEIEIHIGRIEVIAVQPAQAARPAALARKSMSLDEYLKRNNGGRS